MAECLVMIRLNTELEWEELKQLLSEEGTKTALESNKLLFDYWIDKS
jgi:hypothetical protein